MLTSYHSQGDQQYKTQGQIRGFKLERIQVVAGKYNFFLLRNKVTMLTQAKLILSSSLVTLLVFQALVFLLVMLILVMQKGATTRHVFFCSIGNTVARIKCQYGFAMWQAALLRTQEQLHILCLMITKCLRLHLDFCKWRGSVLVSRSTRRTKQPRMLVT